MIRLDVFKQLSKFTYSLERMGQDDQIRGIQAIDQVHIQSEKDEIR